MEKKVNIDDKMYLARQALRMSDELLKQLAEGPDEEWRAPARQELVRRNSPIALCVNGAVLGLDKK